MNENPSMEIAQILKGGPVEMIFAPPKELMEFILETKTKGLYVDEPVHDLLRRSVSIPIHPRVTLGRYEFLMEVSDRELESVFARAVFKETEGGKEILEQVIASCILAQWRRGAKGLLHADRYANVFCYEDTYGRRFFIRVGRDVVARAWIVSALPFGENQWFAGRILFTRLVL